MLWDMRASTRDPLQTLKDATSSITSLTIPPDSVQIIAGSMDGHIRAYDIRMGQMTEDLVGCEFLTASSSSVRIADHTAPVTAVVPSPSSPKDTLLVASQDGKLRLFDRSNGSVSLSGPFLQLTTGSTDVLGPRRRTRKEPTGV